MLKAVFKPLSFTQAMLIIPVLYHVSKIDLIINTLVLIIKKLNINSMSPYFSPESICHLRLSITNSFWI